MDVVVLSKGHRHMPLNFIHYLGVERSVISWKLDFYCSISTGPYTSKLNFYYLHPQGNGHERDFMGRKDVYILDVYNKYIYPNDKYAKRAISRKVELFAYTEDEEYLERVST